MTNEQHPAPSSTQVWHIKYLLQPYVVCIITECSGYNRRQYTVPGTLI